MNQPFKLLVYQARLLKQNNFTTFFFLNRRKYIGAGGNELKNDLELVQLILGKVYVTQRRVISDHYMK